MKKRLCWGLFLTLFLLVPMTHVLGGEAVEDMFQQVLRSNDVELNRATLQRIIDLAPDSAYGHFSKGWFLGQEGNYKRALAEYRTALEIQPQFGEARHNLATAYFHLGLWPEAIREYEKVLRQYPEWGDTRLNLGSAYYMSGRHFASVSKWEEALDLAPDMFIVHYYLGLGYDQLGRKSEARRHYLHFLMCEKDDEAFSEYIALATKRQAEIWVEEGRERT